MFVPDDKNLKQLLILESANCFFMNEMNSDGHDSPFRADAGAETVGTI